MRGHLCNWGEQCELFTVWHRTMQRRVKVYDNSGATYMIDRYTVLIKRQQNGKPIIDIYTMSEHPLSPQGVNLYSHSIGSMAEIAFEDGETRVQVQDLPEEVIHAIEQRIG